MSGTQASLDGHCLCFIALPFLQRQGRLSACCLESDWDTARRLVSIKMMGATITVYIVRSANVCIPFSMSTFLPLCFPLLWLMIIFLLNIHTDLLRISQSLTKRWLRFPFAHHINYRLVIIVCVTVGFLASSSLRRLSRSD